MQPVEKPKVFVAQQEKAPEAAVTDAMKDGLRNDYCELKEEVRAKLKKRINDSAAARKYMADFFNLVMDVRDVEYEKRVTSAVYEGAVLKLSKLYEKVEELPAPATV